MAAENYENGLSFAYQPIVRLSDLEVHGYEALVRFNGIDPSETETEILRREDLGVAAQLDLQVLNGLSAIFSAGDILFGKNLNLNLSAQSISDRSFLGDLQQFVESFPDPTRLYFELTETAPITDLSAARSLAAYLYSRGSGLLCDDFGTGHADSSRFLSLPFHGLKVDGAYVGKWHSDKASRAFAAEAVEMAKCVSATTTAEFISSKRDIELARSLGIDFGQGYFLGRPLPVPADPREVSRAIREAL